MEGKFDCFTANHIEVCLDEEIVHMYSEPMKLDYIENQGFRLLTKSQYLATHLGVLKSVAEL